MTFAEKILQVDTVNLNDYKNEFKDFISLENTPQSKSWHAEGNVLTHTNMVMERAREQAVKETNKALGINLYLGALLHDFGKADVTEERESEKITAYGHEGAGVWRAREFLRKYFPMFGYARREYILSLVEFHGHPKRLIKDGSKDVTFKRLSFDVNTKQIYDLEKADFAGRISNQTCISTDYLDEFKIKCKKLNIWDKHYQLTHSSGYSQLQYNLVRWNILFNSMREDDTKKLKLLEKLSKKEPRCGLLIPIGAPGSGKTSYISKQYPHLELISMDEERKRLCGTMMDMSRNREAYLNCFAKFRQLVKERKNIIWDATNTTRKIRKRLIQEARLYGIEIVIIHFDLPLSVVLERNKNRDRVVPEDIVKRYYKEIQSPHSYEYDHLLVVDAAVKL